MSTSNQKRRKGTQHTKTQPTKTQPSKTVPTRWVALGAIVVALLLAGVVSFYASGDPDGLNRVALDEGFSGTEKQHAAGDGPFSGYATSWIDSERLSGGFAGVVGVLVVLALTGGLAHVVRRRRTDSGRSDATSHGDHQSVG